MVSSERVLASLCDPLTVTQERYVILTRKSGEPGYSERQLFTAQADSIRPVSGPIPSVLYKDLDGKVCVKKIVGDVLEDALPPHKTITNWCEVEFDSQGVLLFAKHVTNHGRETQYWTLKGDTWRLLHEGKIWERSLDKVYSAGTNRVYKSSYSDAGLTLEFLNLDTSVFEPTNVTNIPVSVVLEKNFIESQKDPRVIVALKNYRDGVVGWTFLDDEISAQYDTFIKKLRAKWTAEGRHFTDAPFGVLDLKLEDDQVYEAWLQFHQNPEIRGTATLHGEEVSVEWRKPMDRALPLHPPLQTQHVKVDGHDVPYYYVPPAVAGNGKTLILMQGGPHDHYKGNFAPMIHHYTQNGWGVIVPQESLRTGYGWQHFAKGIGEIGRGNLHQLLHVFYDAQAKGLIPDINQVSLYGHSYGGFVATSFALRWSELHKGAGLKEQFHFQSIVADAAWVNATSEPSISSLDLPDDELDSAEDYMHRIMPIHRVKDPLSAPLFVVHSKTDVRCSAAHTQEFMAGLKAAGKYVPLFWHKGGHNPPEHTRYPEFVAALMERNPTDALAAEIGLSSE